MCWCLIEVVIRVAYQIPAGWVAGGAKLVMGGEDDEDFGCHFGGFLCGCR